MACRRDKIVNIINYLENDLGISVNISKNKARGNKGFFCSKNGHFRIDISKSISDENLLPVLLHEFAHYIHYRYDNKLKNLNFIFEDISDIEQEELITVTVNIVPKDFALSLSSLKDKYKSDNIKCIEYLKKTYPSFLVSKPLKDLEKSIKFPYKYLLKYDNVKVFNDCYSISDLLNYNDLSLLQINYLKFKSNLRKISKINSKINRLNKYYNQPTELWARFFETYFIDNKSVNNLAPFLCKKFNRVIALNKIPEITYINSVLNS